MLNAVDEKNIIHEDKLSEFDEPVVKEKRIVITPDEEQWFYLDEFLKTDYEILEDGTLKIISSARYSNDTVDEYGKEQVLEWIKQDDKRYNEFKKGRVWLNCYHAEAVIYIPYGKKNQTIKTMHICSIASDTEDLDNVKQDLYSWLDEILEKMDILH